MLEAFDNHAGFILFPINVLTYSVSAFLCDSYFACETTVLRKFMNILLPSQILAWMIVLSVGGVRTLRLLPLSRATVQPWSARARMKVECSYVGSQTISSDSLTFRFYLGTYIHHLAVEKDAQCAGSTKTTYV